MHKYKIEGELLDKLLNITQYIPWRIISRTSDNKDIGAALDISNTLQLLHLNEKSGTPGFFIYSKTNCTREKLESILEEWILEKT